MDPMEYRSTDGPESEIEVSNGLRPQARHAMREKARRGERTFAFNSRREGCSSTNPKLVQYVVGSSAATWIMLVADDYHLETSGTSYRAGWVTERRLPGRHSSVAASPLPCQTGLLVGRSTSERSPPSEVVFCPQARAWTRVKQTLVKRVGTRGWDPLVP